MKLRDLIEELQRIERERGNLLTFCLRGPGKYGECVPLIENHPNGTIGNTNVAVVVMRGQ